MKDLIDIFRIFEDFKAVAPKNLIELQEFEDECRKTGREGLAEYLWEWRVNQEYHIYREHQDDEIEEQAIS